MTRSAGILLPVSSLDSNFGIGSFSEAAYRFVDWLEKSNVKYWQILPLGPTGLGDSPYQSFSAFAGNPYFISLEKLINDGLLCDQDCINVDFGTNPNKVDYGKLYENRLKVLKKAYNSWKETESYYVFESVNGFWLEDYATFMAIKSKINSDTWLNWSHEIKYIDNVCKEILSDEIRFHKFMQYIFYSQWHELKSYANKHGIKIIGDIPIYVSMDSSDAWSNPKLFQFDENLNPTFVAGCPPDGFSKNGQLWGNPLYNWVYHKNTDYKWWIQRFRHNLSIFDGIRIDHFRGFESYYAIPYGSIDAKNGKWEKGPSYDLFYQSKDCLDDKLVIAEDLGFITDDVKKLLKKTGFMSTKVLEFAFGNGSNDESNVHAPHNYTNNCTVYTSTHDNETLVGWLNNLPNNVIDKIKKYLNDAETEKNELYKELIALCMKSKADLCIIPLQDVFGLGNEARINIPATTGNNWTWRMSNNCLNDSSSQFLANLIDKYDRNRKTSD